MVIERGKTEMLECRVKGKPPPSISWWRDGKQVPHDHDQHPHHLWHHDHLETGFSLLLGIIYVWQLDFFQVEGSGPTLEVDAAGWWGCR